MNTPTEAHYQLAHDILQSSYQEESAQFIAASEARACDQLRSDLERADTLYQRACEVERELRAEVENEAKWAAHYLTEARAAEAERDHLQAQLRALTLICGTNDANKFETWIDRANARAERAEAAETVALVNWNGALERAIKAEADLAAAKERLRSEAMDDYASIKDLQRELAIERARLDAGTILLTVAGERVWHCGVDLRAAIDAAMKEDAK